MKIFVCRVPSVTSNGAESGTEEDEEMAAEEDESEGEDDLPLEMVDDAGRSNKVCTHESNLLD